MCDETGLATIEILAFEDRGAHWDLPYEEVHKYQFKKGSSRASAEAVDRIQREAARLLRGARACRRSASDQPMQLTRSISAALTATDPDLVFGFRPMTDQVSANVIQERVVALLSGFFGALALLLAGLGLYGMTAYTIACRWTELGVRMALGATASRVVRLVVSRTAWLVAVGILLGAIVSAWASKFVATLLFGLEPQDPATLIATAIVLAAVGILAAWLPAWRATRIDPATVLREG